MTSNFLNNTFYTKQDLSIYKILFSHSTSWEFPELSSGAQKMISDCDGHHYPWYGSRHETVVFEGPCKMYQTATISMNDNFHPHVTWRNPANRTPGN